MAEEYGQSRTEAPTTRRRDEARRQGQIAFSAEFTNAVQLLVGAALLWWGGRTMGCGLLDAMRLDLAALDAGSVTAERVPQLAAWLLFQGAGVVGFFVGLMFVSGLAVSVVQVGVHVTPELVGLRWDRLSLGSGLRRMFSMAAGMRAVMAVCKIAALTCVACWVLRGRGVQIASLHEGTLAAALEQSWDILIRLTLALGGALVLIGLADYTYQRLRHEYSLMMTRQELKEELRREEGDPHTRGRLRRVAREIAQRRMMQDVPLATVVITNPTHLAIALRYERGVTAAPRIVAKGAGAVAQRIVTLARNHAIPVVERKPLAQALFRAVKVGQEIPTVLYYAVAEVLAYVYRLRGES